MFQNIRKRDIHCLNSEGEIKIARDTKSQDNITSMTSQTNVSLDLSGTQHQPSINNVAMDVEVHYNECNINNNSNGRNVSLDVAKITAGAPGIKLY